MTTALFCLPHAGATTVAMRHWPEAADDHITIHPVERLGRGRSAHVPQSDAYNLDAVLADAATRIVDVLETQQPQRWAVMGHSFGALLAVSVAAQLESTRQLTPDLVIASCGAPPRWQATSNDVHHLDDDQLNEHIAAIGQTSREVLFSPVGKMIRRNFRQDQDLRLQTLTALYPEGRATTVSCPLLAVSARHDPFVSVGQMSDWAEHTTAQCDTLIVDGGHFSVVDDPTPVFDVISHKIDQTDDAEVIS